MYADDTVLYTHENRTRCQTYKLHGQGYNMAQLVLSANVSKTIVMFFTNKNEYTEKSYRL